MIRTQNSVIEGSNLKPKIILDQPASQIQLSDHQPTHNALFLKKVIFGEKMGFLLKIDYFGEN